MAKKAEMDASGATIEKKAKDAVDMSHPAVENEPRAGVPEESNKIDFNDPTLSQAEAVAANLKNG